MNADAVKRKIIAEIDQKKPDLSKINKDIFENPEINYEEKFAARYLAEYLESNGFSIKKNIAGLSTAFEATRKGKGAGPVIAIIAEYDALPGIGHACGHSMIAASSCVAAAAIRAVAPNFPGTLKVIGTPAEEGGGGKVVMIKKKIFDGIDAAIMTHPSNKTRVACRMYAVSDIEFTFTGKASHAAAFPDQGINALDAGVMFYNAVSALRQQMKDEARVHGIFTMGGEAPNIIPEKIVMRYYVRALHVSYFNEIKKRVIECAKGAAKATGCKVRVKSCGHTYLPFYPNYPMAEAFRANMPMAGIKEESFSETEEIGSSDIGNLSQVIPTLHPEYAIGGLDDINHSRNFLSAVMSKKGEKAMTSMTRAMALTVYDLLADRALMKRVKADFAKAVRE